MTWSSEAILQDAIARLAFQAARDAFIAVGGEGYIVVVNPAAAALLGQPAEQLIGQSLGALAAEPEPGMVGGDVLHPLGEGRLRLEPLGGPPTGDAVVLYRLSPIGAAVRPDQQGESLGVLAGGIAHKFNNLLTSILGFATLASREVNASQLVRMALQQIEEASRQAADVCARMLAYAGKGRVSAERADLSAVVRGFSRFLDPLVPAGSALTLQLAEDLPAVLSDVHLLGQVVTDLVANAAEAIDNRPGHIIVRTASAKAPLRELPGSESAADDWVVLEVSDTGCGMDELTRARIFEPFFTTKFVGRGLGLPSVLGIVRSHKGTITVDSVPGQGTTVRLFFPGLPRGVPGGREGSSPAWGKGTILIVDADEGVRRVTGLLLEKMGFRVVPAGHGQAALAVLDRQGSELCLALVDLTRNRFEGESTVSELHRRAPGLPQVLMVSGPGDEKQSRGLGGKVSFLHKPFTPPALEHSVRAVLPAG